MGVFFEGKVDVKTLSPVALAFLGDGVYTQLTREYLVCCRETASSRLHRMAVEMVRAEAQAAAYDRISPVLTEEEQTVFRRGRNANLAKIPKNCTREEYAKATGLEALFGYLWATGRPQRAKELFEAVMAGFAPAE